MTRHICMFLGIFLCILVAQISSAEIVKIQSADKPLLDTRRSQSQFLDGQGTSLVPLSQTTSRLRSDFNDRHGDDLQVRRGDTSDPHRSKFDDVEDWYYQQSSIIQLFTILLVLVIAVLLLYCVCRLSYVLYGLVCVGASKVGEVLKGALERRKQLVSVTARLEGVLKGIESSQGDWQKLSETISLANSVEKIPPLVSCVVSIAGMFDKVIKELIDCEKHFDKVCESLCKAGIPKTDPGSGSQIRNPEDLLSQCTNLSKRILSLISRCDVGSAQVPSSNVVRTLQKAEDLKAAVESCRSCLDKRIQIGPRFSSQFDLLKSLLRSHERLLDDNKRLQKDNETLENTREKANQELIDMKRSVLDLSWFGKERDDREFVKVDEQFRTFIQSPSGIRELNQRLVSLSEFLKEGRQAGETEYYDFCKLGRIKEYLDKRSFFIDPKDSIERVRQSFEGNWKDYYSLIYRAWLLLKTYWPANDRKLQVELSHTSRVFSYVFGQFGIVPHSDLRLLEKIEGEKPYIKRTSQTPIDSKAGYNVIRKKAEELAREYPIFIDVVEWGFDIDGKVVKYSVLRVKGPGEGW